MDECTNADDVFYGGEWAETNGHFQVSGAAFV